MRALEYMDGKTVISKMGHASSSANQMCQFSLAPDTGIRTRSSIASLIIAPTIKFSTLLKKSSSVYKMDRASERQICTYYTYPGS